VRANAAFNAAMQAARDLGRIYESLAAGVVGGHGFEPERHVECGRTSRLQPSRADPPRSITTCSAEQLAGVVKNRLKRIQYRPALINGFLAQIGLTLEPEPS
jgi:hypothetical protein